jgi:two-component sensor histidine kinase
MGIRGAEKVLMGDVFITEELARRAGSQPDYLQEKRALQELAVRMMDRPAEVLPRFVDLAMNMAEGVSAGLSLYVEGSEPKAFRWCYLRGTLAAFEGATTPRDFSPCGITLDEMRPILSRHPERYYDWIAEANIVVPELLLVPLYRGSDEPLGTLWIVSDQIGHFNAGHARSVSELASFVSIALHMLQIETRVKQALDYQEVLAKEMSHRVKNLFAIVDGLIRLSARGVSTKEELAQVLSGRVRALADAHGLVRHSFSDESAPSGSLDLSELLRTIVRPYETSANASRFSFSGPSILCDQRAVNGIALIAHELATNAAKHGALANDNGLVDINWSTESDKLIMRWSERGGPVIDDTPAGSGFGSKLLRDTIASSFRGTLSYDWKPYGVEVTIQLSLNEIRS